MWPKKWDTGSAGGEAKVRQLQDVPTPYLTAAGDGWIAQKKGEFSEVRTFGGGDGWFCMADGSHPPVGIHAAPLARGTFKKTGTLPLASGTLALATGDGWGYVTQLLGTDGFGVQTLSVRRTTTGGRDSKELFQIQHLNDALSNASRIVATAAHVLHPVFLDIGVGGVAEDIAREKPYIQGYSKEPEPAGWTHFDLPLPTLAVNKDYTFPQFEFLLPNVYLAIITQVGELPTLWISPDQGTSWVDWDPTDLFPDLDLEAIAPESSFPGSADAKRAAFIAQAGVQHAIALAYDVEMSVISLRKVVITTYYRYNSTDYGTTETLYDVFTGTIVAQTTYRTPGDNVRVRAFPVGEGSWLHFHDLGVIDMTSARFDEFEITTDFGATFTPVTPQGNFRAFASPVGYYHEVAGDPRYGTIYYVVSNAGARELWWTQDNFATTEKRATVAKATQMTYAFDYELAVWVGQPSAPAPIEPRFPWTRDSRVATPEWWFDGIPH